MNSAVRQKIMAMRLRSCLQLLFCIAFLLLACDGSNNNDENDSSSDWNNVQSQDDDGYYYQQYNASSVEWQADDPYFPQDDYVLYELKMIAQADEMLGTDDELEESDHPLFMVVACLFPIAGLVSAIFCTAVTLHFYKVISLMKLYKSEGVVCKATVLASDPNIRHVMEKEQMGVFSELEHARSLGQDSIDDSKASHDNYTVMTEDNDEMSYRYQNRRMLSVSDDSEGDNEDDESAIHASRIQRHCYLPTRNMGREEKATNRSKRGRDVRFNLEHLDSEKKIRKEQQKLSIQNFRAVAEYNEITAPLADEQYSRKVRKHFVVHGSDLQIVKQFDSPEDGLSHIVSYDIFVELYVLPGYPLSGYPCAEVRQALRWHKHFAIAGALIFGLVVIASGVVVAIEIFQPLFFMTYASLLILQYPVISSFIGGSLSKLLSSEYLEQGVILSSEKAKEPVDEKEILSMLEEDVALRKD